MHRKFSIPAGRTTKEPIALIGIGCRFPGGADNPAAFWDLLISGKDAIVEVPKDRWDMRRFYDPDPDKPGKMYVRAGGFLQERIDQFDAWFFGVSPREAVCMDSQQRILLEVAWEALEDAGLVPERLAGSDAGVYIGAFTLDNQLTQMSAANRELIGSHTAVGSTMTILSNRISYVFDLRGPSVSMDTACSSSLVALHYACQALWRGECSLALAGGVNVIFRPEYSIAMCKGQFLSPDGRCKSFDERANGYARGEGAGIVVLKPLSAALRDRDPIYALVRGTGVNQDGRTSGITVPNPEAQEALIRRVCEEANVAPRQIRYFEAHGTGTPVGDPIEARALGAAVGKGRTPENACVVGSVKTNIGHLEAASGIAGLIKATLCLTHKQIPPLANLQTPNPNIPFEELGLRLPRQLEPMPKGEGPACVGVNSFGYGGTNAHAILEEPPYVDQRLAHVVEETIGRPYLLPLSARSDPALTALARAYLTRLSGPNAPSLHNLCYSAGVRRGHHDHRLALVAGTREDLAEQLQSFLEHGKGSRLLLGKAVAGLPSQPVFVFTGMGPQWWAMGRKLLQHEPVFRQAAQQCDAIFQGLAGWSILAEMNAAEDRSRMTETQIAQPANFVLQVGLANLWRSWGIEPAAIVGHSVGEVSAAYVAGVLSLEDAVRVSYHRSRIQKKAAGLGTMLAVGLTLEQAEAMLAEYEGRVSLAAANSPSALTLAGAADALQEIAARLEAKGVFNRFLQVEVAYHSPYMDPLLDEVRESLSMLRTQAPGIPLYSTVTGRLVAGPSYDAEYWCRNIRQPVLFATAMEGLIGDGHQLFLEIGPHPVLSTSIKECLLRHGVQGAVLASLRRGQPERGALIEALGGLYTAGYPVDWLRLYPAGGRYVRLPTYPWQRETHWQESDEALLERLGDPSTHIFLSQRLSVPNPCWRSVLNEHFLPYLGDHRVDGMVVFPGAAYVEAGLAVLHHLYGKEAYALEDLRFHKALMVEPGDEPLLHLDYAAASREYAIFSRTRDARGSWMLHATGRLLPARPRGGRVIDLQAVREFCREAVDAESHYRRMEARGLQYGPWFQGVRRLWRRDNEVLAEIEGHDEALNDTESHLHPTLLDACFQSLIAILDEGDSSLYLPVRIRQLRLYASPKGRFWSYGRLTRRTPEAIEGNISLCDEQGNLLAEVCGLHCQALASKKTGAIEHLEQWTYQYLWERTEPETVIQRTGQWWVFLDQGGIGEQLAEHLQATGTVEVIRVLPGAVFQQEDCRQFRIRRGNKNDLERLMECMDGCQGVAYLWGLDAGGDVDDPTGMANVLNTLHLVQVLGQANAAKPPRLFIITQGVQQVDAGDAVETLAQAPLLGLARVAFNEYPSLRCTLVDLDPNGPNVALLAEELLADRLEDDIALRRGERYSHRLGRLSLRALEQARQEPVPATTDQPCELEVGVPGDIESLCFRETRRRVPGPGEVEIQIHAVVLDAGDMREVAARSAERARPDKTLYRQTRQVAGTVTQVGPGVTDFRVGNALVACLQGGLSTYITTPVDTLFAMPKPDGVGFAEGAGLALDFVAAYYGLHHVARLQCGETLLVRGITRADAAVVQVARWLGARILATNEGATWHGALQDVDHVLDSGSLDLVDEVMALTGNRGVDVVLNMEAPGMDTDGLRILTPCGRYVRLEREDGGNGGQDAAMALEGNLSLATVDVRRMMAERPDLCRRVLQEVEGRFQAPEFTPPYVRVFPATQVMEAFHAMKETPQPAVISLGGGQAIPVLPRVEDKTRIDADGTYLITGGFGGFGLKIAEWMVAQGARHLVLVGRHGAATPQAQEAVQALEAAGAQVLPAAADIASEADVVRLLDGLAAMPALKGIVHAAAVLDDAPLAELDDARFTRTMAPKALGAWYLHRHTRNLDFFILFSSVSCLIGNARQGNYVAGNAFLDTLAHYRRARGLPATSINWGALAGVGMAAQSQEVERHLELMGIRAFRPAQALEALARVLAWDPVQIGIMDVDWQKWAHFEPTGGASPRFSNLVARDDREEASVVDALCSELLSMEPGERKEILALMLAEQVAGTLRLPTDRIDLDQPLTHMGIDSLMAVELQTGINLRLGVEISTLELMKGNSITQMAEQFMVKMGIAGERIAVGEETMSFGVEASSTDWVEGVNELSDEDVGKLLDELLV